MKKTLVICVLFLVFISSGLKAQEKPFVFGFKVAPNIAWMNPSSEGYEPDGSKIGFSWGLMAEFYLMENYNLNSGVNVLYLNGTLKYDDDIADYGGNGTLFRKYNFKYLEIPITLKMKTNAYADFSFFGIFGFGANILLLGEANDRFVPETGGEVTDKKDIKSQLKSFRASLIIGVGLEFNAGESTKLIAGVNFDNGMTDVLKFQNNATNVIHKSINNFLEFYIGILF